jgi:hypothetical protein
MGTYKIVYRDAAGTDRKAFTTLEDNATIEENLTRIVPKAVEKGLLHPEATAQNVLVEHNSVRLNLKLPVQQAAPGIQEHDDLIVRYLASQISLRMRFVADDPNDQRKIFFGRRKSLSIEETVAVSPSEPLFGQIEGKLGEIRGKHRFFGREVKETKQFKLHAPSKKINPDLSLAEQGFETDLEVRVKPRIWFDWPPCFFYPHRGPYTAYAIVLGVLLPIIALFFWIFGEQDVPRFHVTFEAPFEFNIKVDDSDQFIPIENGKPTCSLLAGSHTVRIYPFEEPIRTQPLLLQRKARSVEDSMWTVRLEPPAVDTTMIVKKTPVRVVGYEGPSSIEDNLRVALLVNGFEYQGRDEPYWQFELKQGEYEVKFKLDDSQYIGSEIKGGVGEKSKFVFALEDTVEARVILRYGAKEDS